MRITKRGMIMRGRRLLYVLGLLLLSTSFQAQGLSDKEITESLEQLKKDNQTLRQEVDKLRKSDSSLVEKHVEGIDKKSTKRIASLKRLIDKQEKKFTINGFLSAGAVYSYKENAFDQFTYDDTLNFTDESVLGMQMTYKLSNKTETVTQFVARGFEVFDLQAEWAYVRHTFNDWFTGRAGRLRIPNYLFSEVLEVGFAYPWARPPFELYTTRISAFEGVDGLFKVNTAEWANLIQVYGGTARITDDKAEISGKDIFGANITSSRGAWTLRASTFNSNMLVDINEPVDLPEIGEQVKFHSLGAMYDDGELLSILELGKTDSRTGAFRGDSEKGNFTVGWYYQKFMPYYGFGREYSLNDKSFLKAGSFLGGTRVPFTDYKSHTLGIRYSLNSKAALKFEWNHYFDIEPNNDPADPRENFGPFENDVGERTDIYTIILDTVF